MIRTMNVRAMAAGFLLLLVCGASNAASITWFLDGVTFDDGTSATGFFTYDAATNVYSDISITTEAGLGFAGGTYTIAASPFSNPSRLLALENFPSMIGDILLDLQFSSDLTESGGTVPLLTFAFSSRETTCVELFPSGGNCMGVGDPTRDIVSGTVSAVPVPAAAWLFSSALVLLGWMKRSA